MFLIARPLITWGNTCESLASPLLTQIIAPMTDRLIISEADGGWSASLANTIVSYSFIGGEEAEDSIQALALGMKHAKQLVIDGIDEDLIFNRGGETGAEIYASLFPTTNSLQYEGNVIFTATEGATLDAELELAGDALGAALLLRIASSKVRNSGTTARPLRAKT